MDRITQSHIKYLEDTLKTFDYLIEQVNKKYDLGIISLNYLNVKLAEYECEIYFTKERLENIKLNGIC